MGFTIRKRSKLRGIKAIGLECILNCLKLVKTDDPTEYLSWFIVGYETRKYHICSGYNQNIIYTVGIKDITIWE